MNAWALFNAGEDYAKLGEFSRSIEYCQKSLNVFQEMNDKLGLSGAYMSFAIAYKLKEDYDKSYDYFQKTISLREELAMPYRLADGLYECGLMLIKKDDSELAIDYLQRSLTIFREINSISMIQRAEKALASI